METILYTLSSLFYYPVLAVLCWLLCKVIYDAGRFCREWTKRKESIQPVIKQITALPPAKDLELSLQTILQQFDIQAQQKIRTAGYSIKMGPTVGLIGTLTPMAKALSGLAQGNLASLASQMITAFSTTVLGLVVGGIAFTIMHVRVKWHRQDSFKLACVAEEKLLLCAS